MVSDNVSELFPQPPYLTCICGSTWYTTDVCIDATTRRVTGYSVSGARCQECGRQIGALS